ncbi:ArsR/SmtB family transcription factor [Actinopolymorpha alba]|uniref:ArsR/SmtB family transcription factor n=1 Tax=Actinopolymorpha alba TaxID=533267 RepID=UPI000378BBD4|nr:metalloregulator ArsR/SmtB family transcription factor [Actinopolymorpha alba]
MGHQITGAGEVVDVAPPARIDSRTAKGVAATLQALSTPSRLLILGRLREAPATVTELAESVEMEQSAVSHQLRLLRTLGLVTSERSGRTIVYSLYDNHVARLLDEAVYHAEHLRLGLTDEGANP